MANGRFREDLFYRLSVFPIQLPPLRERRADIPVLSEYSLSRLVRRLGRGFEGIEPKSLERLVSFSWPGNIRQLQNVIEHSAILCDDPWLTVPSGLIVEKPDRKVVSRLNAALRTDERRMIEQALEEAEGRVAGATGAAARLGVLVCTLEWKIKRFSIDKLCYRGKASPVSPPG